MKENIIDLSKLDKNSKVYEIAKNLNECRKKKFDAWVEIKALTPKVKIIPGFTPPDKSYFIPELDYINSIPTNNKSAEIADCYNG